MLRVRRCLSVATCFGLVVSLSSCTKGTSSAPATQAPATQAPGTQAPATQAPSATLTPETSAAQSGWLSEKVGTYTQFQGGVDSIAFAPDGRAVAFTSLDTSCCSTATFGWARPVGTSSGSSGPSEWNPLADAQETFVTGDAFGAMGGPVDVAWFRNRFVAVGSRGFRVASDSDTPTSAIPTTWTSTDGVTWSAHEEPGESTPLDLLVALDGESLLGLWTSGENLDIRSTNDGITWETISTLTTLRSGSSLYGGKLTSISSPDDKPARYIVTGMTTSLAGSEPTTAFVSISADGSTWATQELTAGVERAGTSVEASVSFNGRILVYGTLYSETTDGTPRNKTAGWASDDGGRTFAPLEIASPCSGAITSVAVDKAAPEPTMFAICTTLGAQEGDSIAATDELVKTNDGESFETPPNMVPEWSTPSDDLSLGPVTVQDGRIVLPVVKPNGEAGRMVSLWRT
jgi:hypothetical protein